MRALWRPSAAWSALSGPCNAAWASPAMRTLAPLSGLRPLASSASSSHRDEDAQPAAVAAEEDAAQQRAASPGGLALEQLAKALLASSTRAQLTTVVAGSPAAEEPKVASAVVQFLAPRGCDPLILLHPELHKAHLANLEADPKVSLCTGHLSPPQLVQRVRSAGWLPTRALLLGRLERLPASEVRFRLQQARKAWAGRALEAALPSEAAAVEMAGFRMPEPLKATYVDATGKQHELQPWDLDAAFLDPLAPHLPELLTELNEDPDWSDQLRLFCAAYLRQEEAMAGVLREGWVSSTLVTEVDRHGFTLLGRLPAAASSSDDSSPGVNGEQQAGQQEQQQQQRWRQFRFQFQREMRDADAFWTMLDEMRTEVEKAAAGGEQQE